MDCLYLTKCQFFKDILNNMPAAMDLMKKQYCQNNYQDCARYKVAVKIGPEKIPSDLYPKDIARAAMLIIQ